MVSLRGVAPVAGVGLIHLSNSQTSSHEPLSELLVSPLMTPIIVPYIIPYITHFKEFRL